MSGPRRRRNRVLGRVNDVLRRGVGREIRVVAPDRRDPGIARLVRRLPDPVELRYAVYDRATRTLYPAHNAGFFSNLSVTLWSVADLAARGHVPERLDFTESFSGYKDEADADIVGSLFEPPEPSGLERIAAMPPRTFTRFDQHGPYEDLDLAALGLLRSTYLRPNGTVTARADELRRRSLDPSATYVGMWLRGTDKWTEMAQVDSAVYIDAVEAMLDAGDVDRVLVQTDQAQIRRILTTWFAGRCDVFSDLPVTAGSTAIFETDLDEGRRVAAARDLLAAAMVIAGRERVITATSNIGAWLVMLRGSTTGVVQAREGELVALG